MKLLLVTKRISQAYTIFLGLVNVGWNQWASSFLCCPQVQARPKLCPRCPCPQVNGRPNHCTGAYLQGRPDLCPGPQWRPNTWPCERNDELASHWCCWHLGWCCWPWEWNQEWNQGLSMIQNGPDEVSGAWGIVRQLLWQQDIPFVVLLRFLLCLGGSFCNRFASGHVGWRVAGRRTKCGGTRQDRSGAEALRSARWRQQRKGWVENGFVF